MNLIYKFLVMMILILTTPGAFAHHAFEAEFDVKAPVKLVGKVTKIELINPHSWIHIKVGDQPWEIECGSPNALYREGLDKLLLKVGSVITVHGYKSLDPSCKPSCKANGRDIRLKGGRKIFVGSLGTGAPYDREESND